MINKLLILVFFLLVCQAQAQIVPVGFMSNISPSTNGTGIVSAYTCSTATAGNLLARTAATGVTQTITASVVKTGTYKIKAITNGITFAASGEFTTLGNQTIVLVASGTPTALIGSPYTYTINTSPYCSFTREIIDPSSNGTAYISSYTLVSSSGNLFVGAPASGVTQIIKPNVTTPGTYSISTTQNGVTYSAFGTLSSTGTGVDITLIASGTPLNQGTYNYTTNTTPSISFNKDANFYPSTRGTAEMTFNSSSISIVNAHYKMPVGSATPNNTYYVTMTVNVTRTGTYNFYLISPGALNGVTFQTTGTWTTTGSKSLIFYASGTAVSGGSYEYKIDTTPQITFIIGYTKYCNAANTPTAIVDVTSPFTGRKWMDRNLGASQKATSKNDALSYGDFYQWGRYSDGHQCRNSSIQSNLAYTAQPAHDDFISTNNINSNNWLSPPNNNLWGDISGINNPCPTGYRIPFNFEFDDENNTWINGVGNFDWGSSNSFLKLPDLGGERRNASGNYEISYYTGYWTAMPTSTEAYILRSDNVLNQTFPRSFGLAVRCIKN